MMKYFAIGIAFGLGMKVGGVIYGNIRYLLHTVGNVILEKLIKFLNNYKFDMNNEFDVKGYNALKKYGIISNKSKIGFLKD